MAKIQKTITVEVCDRCSKEGYLRSECCICHKELCSNCDQALKVVIERGKPLGFSLLISNLHHEGLSGTFCMDDAQHAERILREAGFKNYNYDITPV